LRRTGMARARRPARPSIRSRHPCPGFREATLTRKKEIVDTVAAGMAAAVS